jgi:hypothetical protein
MTYLDSEGARYRDESLYRDDEGRWFAVASGDGISIPHIVALTEDEAFYWCQFHSVSRAVIAEHFVVDTHFGPSNELFDLLVRKWSTPLHEEDRESGP